MRVKWEIRYRRRLHAELRANTAVGQRAMRVESGRSPGPWGSFEGKASRTGDRGGESSNLLLLLRLGRATLAAWCDGGSRRASSTLEAVVGIGVRTCSRCCCFVSIRGGDVGGDSREEGGQAGACSPLNVQTVRVSSRAVVAGGGERRMSSSGGRGKGSLALSAAHLVLESFRY